METSKEIKPQQSLLQRIWAGKIFKAFPTIRITCYYALPTVLIVYFFLGTPTFLLNTRTFFGELALYCIIYLLFLKPLSDLTNIGLLRALTGIRRPIGVAAFWLTLFHVVSFTKVLDVPFTELMRLSFAEPWTYLWYGAIAFTLICILGITSNNIAEKKILGHNIWKWVQRIAYIVLPLALLHAALVEGEGLAKPIVIFSLYLVLKAAAFYKKQQARKRRAAAKQQPTP